MSMCVLSVSLLHEYCASEGLKKVFQAPMELELLGFL